MTMIKTQQETILFNEFLNRLCNVYDSVKHLNLPKEKIVSAVINEYRKGIFKSNGNKGRPLAEAEEARRMADYTAGYTDRELRIMWGLGKSGVACWRLNRGLKPNKRG
jgi:dGTP triphosphohydrolase